MSIGKFLAYLTFPLWWFAARFDKWMDEHVGPMIDKAMNEGKDK